MAKDKLREYVVRFEIDVEATSPVTAALSVYRDVFGRDFPDEADSACVFDVEWKDGRGVCHAETVDLEDYYLDEQEGEPRLIAPGLEVHDDLPASPELLRAAGAI